MHTDRSSGAALSDDALLAAAKSDPGQFALLYDRYVDAVFRYCHRRLDDREAAEDATSQIFEKAFSNLPKCRDEWFRPWLFRIAHNVVIDCYRQRRPTVELLDDALQMADEAENPEERAISSESAATLRQLLELLSAEQREVIELRLAGLNGTESMAVLGISREVLGSRTYRAMNRLRSLIEDAEALGVRS
ncbi:MAG: sigma-70 family RNA polymerase sigma factor [Thermomicrobiales bacterium]|nr:sigma-70 family RNA polymerase sigma factor [Thermomicrobiales bacterium]